MYICICNQITESQLCNEIERGATTVRKLRESIGVTNQCGKCANCVKTCLKEYRDSSTASELLATSVCNA